MAERENMTFREIVLVSPNGKNTYNISVKDDTTVPSATEIAQAPLNKIWLKGDAAASDYIGWVKVDATTVKEFGAILP